MIQYVYPDYELPDGYMEVIDEMVHVNIVPAGSEYGIVKLPPE